MAKRRNKNKNKNQYQVEQAQPSHTPQSTTQTQLASPQVPTTKKEVSKLQTIEQKRAKHALNAVESWRKRDQKDKSDQKELKSYIVGMPAMILMSGFGQTCAFYKSKGGNHAEVLRVLADWLGHGDVISFITKSSAQEYQLAQAESLAYLNWLKKFAKAYLDGEE